jgi:hypothetical protein
MRSVTSPLPSGRRREDFAAPTQFLQVPGLRAVRRIVDADINKETVADSREKLLLEFDLHVPWKDRTLHDAHGHDNTILKRNDLRMNRHRALALCLRMIFSDNRFTLFRIMR